MYKTVYSLIVIFLLLTLGVFYSMYRGTSGVSVENTKTNIQILLYPETGETLFKPLGNKTFEIATTSPTIISNQTLVRTGKESSASVLLPDNSVISLDAETEITVSYEPTKISIYQTLGTTYHRVEALISGSSYQVQTPGTLAAVRGTKFAVKFDTKTKKTKVAVTESKVQVSTIPVSSEITGTTTKEIETVLLEEGKTVTVEMITKKEDMTKKAISVIETTKDTEMRTWVEKNKKEDKDVEEIKQKIQDKEERRVEIKRKLFNDEKPERQKEATVEDRRVNTLERVIEETRETTVKTDSISKSTETTQSIRIESTNTNLETPEIKPNTTGTPTQKLDEETFFDDFNNRFFRLFYLDDVDTPCDTKVTPEERVRLVASFATNSGHPFTSTTLLSFAREIQAYCTQKDKGVKSKLQIRFDEEFPYKESI